MAPALGQIQICKPNFDLSFKGFTVNIFNHSKHIVNTSAASKSHLTHWFFSFHQNKPENPWSFFNIRIALPTTHARYSTRYVRLLRSIDSRWTKKNSMVAPWYLPDGANHFCVETWSRTSTVVQPRVPTVVGWVVGLKLFLSCSDLRPSNKGPASSNVVPCRAYIWKVWLPSCWSYIMEWIVSRILFLDFNICLRWRCYGRLMFGIVKDLRSPVNAFFFFFVFFCFFL